MMTETEVLSAIETARLASHAYVDSAFHELVARITKPATPVGARVYKEPSETDCRDPRNKVGVNLTPEGKEILFRLLDSGAGYNSAGRKMSITQTAVKNRKKDWESAGGVKRQKLFIPYLDTIAS
jgi:hypothetical protein